MTSDTTHLFRRPGANREVMKRVFDMCADGFTHRKIATAIDRPMGSVDKWLANPRKFDPYVDDVAVERALQGDRVVFDLLTMFERQAFLEALVTRLGREPRDPFWHNTAAEPWWLAVLAEKLDIPINTLANAAYRRIYRAA